MRMFLVSALVVVCCGGVFAEEVKTTSENSSVILPLLLKKTPQPNYGVEVPGKITGQVVLREGSQQVGVPGVSVSDGYSVVKTDPSGHFNLPANPDAVFVSVTRPSGYDVVGDWYQPVAHEVGFELKRVNEDENQFTFIHVTDTHISGDPVALAGLSQFVNEVNGLDPPPRFVINSGDLINLSKALLSSPETGHQSFQNYVGIMNHLTMPHYNVAGDHTDSSYRLKQFPRGDHRCGKPMFWEYLGPHFFSFEYGKIHFMSIDYGYHLGKRKLNINGKLLDYPTLQVQPMHTEWMKQDMASRSPGSFVVTSSEHDLMVYCPGFEQMAAKNDVRLQLVGDDHVVSYKSRPVPYRTGGALAGCWWNPATNHLCPDLSPQGYLIYQVTGEKMETFYKGLGQRVGIVSPRIGAAISGAIQVEAHLVQPQENEYLEYSLDGEEWIPMKKTGAPFYRDLYAAQIDATQLEEGYLDFRVRSNLSLEERTRRLVIIHRQIQVDVEEAATLSFRLTGKNAMPAGANPKPANSRLPVGKTEVLFNGKVIGALSAETQKEYSFKIEASLLRRANTLSFRFEDSEDGFTLAHPVLVYQGREIRDPRDAAIHDIKLAHWGKAGANFGGYIVGNAEPPDETPFQRRQSTFCFVLNPVPESSAVSR